MPLDFARAADLFTGTEQELAMALDLAVADVRQYRANPQRVPGELMVRLGRVLVERGTGMRRVGELLQQEHGGG